MCTRASIFGCPRRQTALCMTHALVLCAARQAGWVASQAPRNAADLVMHRKKVEEVRGWLTLQLQPGRACTAPRVLLLTGPLWHGALEFQGFGIRAQGINPSACAVPRVLLLTGQVWRVALPGADLASVHWVIATLHACINRVRPHHYGPGHGCAWFGTSRLPRMRQVHAGDSAELGFQQS